MIRASLLLAAGVLVTACSTPGPSGTLPEAGPAESAAPDTVAGSGGLEEGSVRPEMDPLDRVEDTCGLDALKPWLGKQALDIPPEEMPATARIVGPDTQVTMDYVPSRLNVLTDGDGRVIGLKCG